jgi:hypothetical protein
MNEMLEKSNSENKLKNILTNNESQDSASDKSIEITKLEIIKRECELWTQSASLEQISLRKRVARKFILYYLSEVSEDEIILLDDSVIREIDYQILEALEIRSRIEEELEELHKECNKVTEKLESLQEIKLNIVTKKFRATPTTICFPFALVENRRQLKELLLKVIPNLKEAPNVQLELVKMLSSLLVLPKFQEMLEKCQIPEKFGFDIVNEILTDRNHFARIIEKMMNDENRCYVISATNPDKFNSCYVEYARLLNALKKSSAC